MLLRVALTLAAFWHVLAFAGGGVNVALSYRGLFSGKHDKGWARAIRSAEWQLWVSGIALVLLGCLAAGWQAGLGNPKLQAKLVVVTVWLASTVIMRRFAVPRMRLGDRSSMLWVCSVSGACWVYGALLGVAKPLANGRVTLGEFLMGLIATIGVCLAATHVLERGRKRGAIPSAEAPHYAAKSY